MTMTAMPVTLSARAARRIAEILKAEAQPAALRVAVTGGGCSGFQYNFALDDAQLDEDLVVENDGAKVLIDPVSLDFLAGAEIDFTDDLIGQAFKINNPNATAPAAAARAFRSDPCGWPDASPAPVWPAASATARACGRAWMATGTARWTRRAGGICACCFASAMRTTRLQAKFISVDQAGASLSRRRKTGRHH